jgi:phytoene desaturase
MNKAAIIGAGLGGISTSIYLRSKGWEVDVYESQSFPGGKAAEDRFDGFRFDSGPSLVTMPWVFKDVFKAAGKILEEELTLIRLPEICTYYLSDGTYLKAWSDLERFQDELEKIVPGSADAFKKYMRLGKKVRNLGGDLFLTQPIHEIRTLISLEVLFKLVRFIGIHPFSTLNQINKKYFKDPRLVQLFNRYATYNGSNPYKTPATMMIIPYIEYFGGGYGIAEGIFAIPTKLHQAAVEMGVNFHFNQSVTEIKVENKRIKGIITKGEFKEYSVVITDVDVSNTYNNLLKLSNTRKARRYRNLEPSSSGIVFSWGINRSFDELSVNNIFFSKNYPAEFNSLFDKKEIAKEPTVYVNISSKITPTDAPEGCENWFVLINTPPNYGQDWDDYVDRSRNAVLDLVSKRLGVDISSHIVAEQILTPPEIERRTGSTYGSLYGISSNSLGAAFVRHRNRSKRFKGLYFCSGSAHPGGGMPLVISSGKICADLVDKYSRRR